MLRELSVLAAAENGLFDPEDLVEVKCVRGGRQPQWSVTHAPAARTRSAHGFERIMCDSY